MEWDGSYVRTRCIDQLPTLKVGECAIWSQVTALTAMAPAAALGGYLRDRTLRHAKKAPGDIVDFPCRTNG
jgi:hypothetical protein